MFKIVSPKHGSICCLFFLLVSCQPTSTSSPKHDTQPVVKTKNTPPAYQDQTDSTGQQKAKNLHYNELKKYIPEIAGYEKKEEAKGQMIQMSGFAYAQIGQQYVSESGKKANVTIIDYHTAYSLFKVATAFMNTGFFMENDDELIQKVDLGIPNIIALENIRKKKESTTLTIAAGERFLITIQLEDEANAEETRTIAQQIPLTEMLALSDK